MRVLIWRAHLGLILHIMVVGAQRCCKYLVPCVRDASSVLHHGTCRREDLQVVCAWRAWVRVPAEHPATLPCSSPAPCQSTAVPACCSCERVLDRSLNQDLLASVVACC